MNARMRKTTAEILTQFGQWVKDLADEAQQVKDGSALNRLETRVRQEGQGLLSQLFQGLLQGAVDDLPAQRTCPTCGGPRRHKGRRSRGLISSVGAIRLEGPYWYCSRCGGQHAVDVLAEGSVSVAMQELVCLLGTALTSFQKAQVASGKLLGIPVSANFIRRLCQQRGRQVQLGPVEVDANAPPNVMGSCDGTMVNTRQAGWKELKAYRFEHGGHVHGRAFLESSKTFLPRIRQTAVEMKAGRAPHIFWVADAADWIEKGVREQLPMAIQVVDYWHACQHVHDASRAIFGEGTPPGAAWAQRYCRQLRELGGSTVLRHLRGTRYRQAARQAGLDDLLGYLRRNAQRMNYPGYERAGWPISSGPMESFCKQLGLRLKGPGMRWSYPNVHPMATLVSLWATGEWHRYWESAA